MQNKESRLIQAAKRTIRAEATLVIIIIVIASWSTYALYKLAIGSESIFGFTFSKSATPNQDQFQGNLNQHLAGSSNGSEKFRSINENIGFYQRPVNQSQQGYEARYRNHLIQELLDGQRELYANLGHAFPESTHLVPSGHQSQQQQFVNKLSPDNLRALAGYISANNQMRTQTDQRPNTYSSSNPWLNQIQYNRTTDLSGVRLPSSSSHSIHSSNLRKPEITLPDPIDAEINEMPDDSALGDKEAAESNQDPSESFIETSPPGENENTQSYQNSDSTAPDEPQSETDSVDQESTENPDSQSDSSSSDQTDSSTNSEDPSADEESAKEGSQSIDEEVDRMTQPSSGVASQQDRPFDYKNTVQFDDTLTSSNHSVNLPDYSVPPGNLIARFASPSSTVAPHTYETGRKDSFATRDLEVDHNSPVGLNDQTEYSTLLNNKHQAKGRTQSSSEHMKLAKKRQFTSSKDELDQKDADKTPVKLNRGNRQKRSVRKQEKIRAPYEIDDFLSTIDFDSFIGLSSSEVATNVPSSSNNHSSTSKHENNSTGRHRESRKIDATSSKVEPEVLDSKLDFRHHPGNGNYSHPFTGYLTSNNTSIRELLEQKKLLDALRQSQLPPPTYQNVNTSEPKTAGSLNHIDINALLSAAADEDHPKMRKKSSYLSKKKKQHDQMKAQKKSATGYEKGGHKKKKQKKEEKKYLKEKKFKGAKKGKKVSKGQGGAGGKKGKKLYKDRGYKKKGFKNVAHKEEWGHKKSYFDEFRDKDFKKKWKKFDDKYNYAQMKKFQAKDEKGAKKLKHHDEKFKKYDNGRWKKSYQKQSKEHKESSKKNKKNKKKTDDFD